MSTAKSLLPTAASQGSMTGNGGPRRSKRLACRPPGHGPELSDSGQSDAHNHDALRQQGQGNCHPTAPSCPPSCPSWARPAAEKRKRALAIVGIRQERPVKRQCAQPSQTGWWDLLPRVSFHPGISSDRFVFIRAADDPCRPQHRAIALRVIFLIRRPDGGCCWSAGITGQHH